MSHDPCPHCGAERRYGIPEDNPEVAPTPATCSCGKEGPPDLPYALVADKVHEMACADLNGKEGRTCRCGQPLVVGQRAEDTVLAHKMPHCRAFLDLDFSRYLEWLDAPTN